MAEAGVDAAVIHPPSWDPASNELAVEAVREHPDKFCILGNFPLDRPENGTWWTPGKIGRAWWGCASPSTSHTSCPGPQTARWSGSGAAAERAGIPVALQSTEFLPVVGQVAEPTPAFGCGGSPGPAGRRATVKGAAAFDRLPQLLALANYPNVAVKATGAPCYSAEPYPFRDIHDVLRQIFERSGRSACFGARTLPG